MHGRGSMLGLVTSLAAMTIFLFGAASANAVAQEGVLHRFSGPDGGLPSTVLTFDAAGNLYGSTQVGGRFTQSCPIGCGVVFKLSRANGWTEQVLYSFNGKDGYGPSGVIFDADGSLYGATSSGGKYGHGTVFKLLPGTGGKWSRAVIHNFNGTNGDTPQGGLIFDAVGNLYGTTSYGGTHGVGGTVFKLAPGSNGKWTESVLHTFGNIHAGSPYAGLVFDQAGNLYGTTSAGGRFLRSCPGGGCGTIFKLAPATNGRWTYTILHMFDSADGATPYAGLTLDAVGNLYGTTVQGGKNGSGVVLKMSPHANGKWTETVLHSFDNNDGQGPFFGNLIFDAAGNLYGTTFKGGSVGFGTVFELIPGANGQWSETVLYDFGQVNGGGDGLYPYAGLIFDAAGNLYGTTARGGNGNDCSPYGGCGVVFKIAR